MIPTSSVAPTTAPITTKLIAGLSSPYIFLQLESLLYSVNVGQSQLKNPIDWRAKYYSTS